MKFSRARFPAAAFKTVAGILFVLLVPILSQAQAAGTFQRNAGGYVFVDESGVSFPATFEPVDGVARMIARDESGITVAVQDVTTSLDRVRFLVATETETEAPDGVQLPVYEVLASDAPAREKILEAINGDGAIERLFETITLARQAKLNQLYAEFSSSEGAYPFVEQVTRPLYIVVRTRGGIGVSYSGTGFLLKNEVGGQPVLVDNRGVGAVFVPSECPWLEPGSPLFQLPDGRESGFFVLPVVHEFGHQVMDMAYDGFQPEEHSEVDCHATNSATEPALALKEGWAEFFEAYLFVHSDHFDNRRHLPLEVELRQDRAREMRLIYASLGKKTGEVKTGEQLISTEGVVSGLFYNILSHRKVDRAMEKSISVFHHGRPSSYVGFVESWVELYPADRNLITRIFLESTRYATLSPEVPEIYRQVYQVKLAYVKATGAEKEALRQEYNRLRRAYADTKEALFNEATRTGRLSAVVSGGLWVQFPDPGDLHGRDRAVNLNVASLEELVNVPGLRQIAEQFEIRDSAGFIDEYIVADRILEARGRAGGTFNRVSSLVDALQNLPEGAAKALVAALDIHEGDIRAEARPYSGGADDQY